MNWPSMTGCRALERASHVSSILIVLALLISMAAAASKDDIVFVETSWKEYVSKDHDPAWEKGTDSLSKAG